VGESEPDSFAPELEPEVEAACVVCGGRERRVVTSTAELAAESRWLRRFHARRLRDRPGRGALEDRASFTQDYATNVVACAACGLVFRSPRPPAAAVTEAYAQDRYGAERLRALHAAQLELFRPKARTLARWLAGRPDPVVIEIGSFVGGFLAAANERGWRVLGIDPGEEVGVFCASLGLPVRREPVEACDFPPDAADCVAIWSTFDQLATPHPTLAAVRKLLRPGGLLALRIPNGACYARAAGWLRRAPPPLHGVLRAALAWNNLLGFPYLFGYAVPTLDRLLAPYGFARVGFRADVLVRLADGATKAWAHVEERALKAACRAAGALDPRLAPWYDAYYALTTPSGAESGARGGGARPIGRSG
jgi:SAM-dependent methyltransferase